MQRITSSLHFVNSCSRVLFDKDTIELSDVENSLQRSLTDLAIKKHYGEKASYEQLLIFVVDERILQLEALKQVL